MFEKIDKDDLVEQPLGYWEKNSYMIAVTNSDLNEIMNKFFDRIANIDGLTIKEKQELTKEEPGQATLEYDGELYYIGFYPSDFSLPEPYLRGRFYFSNEEIHALRNANKAFTIFMRFNKDAKKSYYLQLKLLVAGVPDLLGVMDESAEKMLPAKWVKMASQTKILPGAEDLYTVQAVSDENDIWLHTHGLCRCGLTELEILKSDKDNYKYHYNIITTFASMLLDKKHEINKGDCIFVGRLANNQPIAVTYLPWTEGIKLYDNLNLGGVKDREKAHNSRTSVIFIYKNKKDADDKRVSFVSDYNDILGNNPLFLISEEETERMKALAIERFGVVRELAENKENKIMVKVALVEDESNGPEHIWFELVAIDGDSFKAKLTQEPYYIKNMHAGDEKWFTIKDLTSWTIYTPKFTINPNNVYIIK